MALKENIDNLDKKILTLLIENARMPFLEIARACGVSGAAIHQRVQRLEEMDLIKGASLSINVEKIGYQTCAYVGVFLEKGNLYEKVVDELRKVPEIVECSYTTGNYAIFFKIYAFNNTHLKEVLNNKVQGIPGIASTETIIALEQSFIRNVPLY